MRMTWTLDFTVRLTLTPALSRRARENRRQTVGVAGLVEISSDALCCPLSHRMGEGQGEGVFSFRNP